MKKNILTLIIIVIVSIIIFIKTNREHKITILDESFLSYSDKNGIKFGGISDIAYDKEKHKLYLIGDRSVLFTFEANFDKKIEKLNYLSAHKILHNGDSYDCEGLTFNSKNNKILVAHEWEVGVFEVSPKGQIKENYILPKKLQKTENYRSRNKTLESIAYHEKYGLLVASEYPIKKDKIEKQTIYSFSGEEWHFKAENYPNCGVTSIEVMDDGNLLVLERSYYGLMKPMRIILKKIYLDSCDKEHYCKSEYIASFNSFKGDGFNNFEGLTRVSKNSYLMISDNNGYKLLPTKLIYFHLDIY